MSEYPHSIESEQAVLYAMMSKPENIDMVAEKVKPLDFYNPRHRNIYRSILSLREKTVEVDSLTISIELKEMKVNDVEKQYILDLSDFGIVLYTNNLDYYIGKILGAASKRNLKSQCETIIQNIANNETNPDEIAIDAEERVRGVREQYVQSGLIKSCDILEQTIEEITMYQEGKKTGLMTPWDDLNKITAGYHPGEFTVLASRPGVGKTSMALNITDHLAVKQGIPVMFFSLEMPVYQLQARMLCSMAKVSFHDIRSGNAPDSDLTKIVAQATPMNEAPIIFDNSSRLEIMTLKTKARQAHKKHGVQIIFIDYLQKLKSPGSENRDREVTVISNELTALAMELYIPVVGLAQLSRDVEKRGKGAIPKLSDLRESGTLEQDATVVTFLHRDRIENKETGKVTLDPETLVIVAKQRHGETGATYLHFNGKYTTFESATMREDSERY